MGGPNWQLSATVAALVLMAPFVARGRGGMAPFERGPLGSETAAREGRPPIIVVPGLAASKLMVALDEDYDYAAGEAAGCGQGGGPVTTIFENMEPLSHLRYHIHTSQPTKNTPRTFQQPSAGTF